MHRPETMWVLIDTSNSNPRSRNYLWWFESRALAREFKRHHASNPRSATLVGPYRYNLMYDGQI